jgi:hypothetical protein
MKVECTNCGGVGPAFWLTLGALSIAAIALYFNFRQYREFARRLNARARFRVTLGVVDADDEGIRRTPSNTTTCWTRVSIGIKNVGDLAANQTVINVLLPQYIEEARWCGAKGQERNEKNELVAAGKGDVVIDDKGNEIPAVYIALVIDRIGTKPDHVVYFQMPIDCSFTHEPVVPVRVKVQADEIPDEIEEYEESILVRVAREEASKRLA